MEVLHPRCAGLDVHKDSVTACLRVADASVRTETQRFAATTKGLLELSDWLEEAGCTHVVMEATGVYWKPVWHVLEGHFELLLANPGHVRQVPGRKSDVNDARGWRTCWPTAWSPQASFRKGASRRSGS